jgi:DNA-binding SARP family transcriptional activator/Tfp pilus assembly protein PilF
MTGDPSRSGDPVTQRQPSHDPATGPGVELRLFGGVELSDRDGTLMHRVLIQPKRLALLVHLTVGVPRGGLRRREAVLPVFWPDSEESAAQRALRQALHYLERHLPSGVLRRRGRTEVGVDPEGLWCDVNWFERLLDAEREGEALQLYGGELMPGFHPDGCPEFVHWLELERDRLRRRAIRAALVLARHEGLGRGSTEVIRWLRFAAVTSRFEEGVLRDSMRLLAEVEDRPGITALFREYDARVREDLGMTLSHDSVELYRSLTGRNDTEGTDADTSDADARHRAGAAISHRPPTLAGASPPPLDREAVSLHAQARHQVAQRTQDAARQAVEGFEAALRRDPAFALAHSGLARALLLQGAYSNLRPADLLPRARFHARAAIRLDDGLAEAHETLAGVALFYDWDWETAEHGFRRTLEIDPRWATRELYAVYFLAARGRFEEAMEQLAWSRTLAVTPVPLVAYPALVRYLAREPEAALEESDAALAMAPELAIAHWFRGLALEGSGRLEEALSAFHRASGLMRRSSLMLAQVGRALARAGRADEARAVLDEIAARKERWGPAPYFRAQVHGWLDEPGPALELLRMAYRERTPLLVLAQVDPGFDPLRNQPGFRELILRLGLRPSAARVRGSNQAVPAHRHG